MILPEICVLTVVSVTRDLPFRLIARTYVELRDVPVAATVRLTMFWVTFNSLGSEAFVRVLWTRLKV